jgi:hypothetical protein
MLENSRSDISLPNEGRIESLEAFSAAVQKQRIQAVVIPEWDKDLPPCFKAAQLQALITWAQLVANPAVRLSSDAFYEETELTPLQVAAVRLCTEALDTVSDKNMRPAAVKNALRSTDQLSRSLEISQRRSEYWIIIPDRTSQSYPRLLYTPGEQVKFAEAFYFLITKAVSLLIQDASLARASLNDNVRRSLSTVLYELFKNTHDWARRSFDGSVIRRSIRVIHIRVFSSNLSHKHSETSLLHDFLERRRRDSQAFVEISILDSGPGYAQRFAKTPISKLGTLDDEYGFIQKCLTVHQSSSEDPRKGVGLHGVLQSIDDTRGFFRIRTGRLSLCRPLDKNPYVEWKSALSTGVARYRPWLLDAESGKLKWTNMPFVAGALISAIIPITTKK